MLPNYESMTKDEVCGVLSTQIAAAQAEALALKEAVRLVVFVARKINAGIYQDERMTGALKAYDAALSPGDSSGKGEAP